MTEELIERLRDRASSYRLGGPSSEHTAALLDEAADRLTVQLSGPPEPSDEEVARVLQPGLFSDDPKERHRHASPFKVEVMQERALVEARRVKQLFRSRRNG